MSLDVLKSILQSSQSAVGQMSIDSIISDWKTQGEKVALFRDYTDGDHRSNLTTEMQKLLRISSTGSLNEFNDNYIDLIIQTMNDRLEVTAIEAVASDENQSQAVVANDWIQSFLTANRFDALQIETHEATIRDGIAYILVDYDNETKRARLTLEPAYDGINGMVVLYESAASYTPLLAIKLWTTTVNTVADTLNINVYYPDRIEKYASSENGGLWRREIEGEPWPAPWVKRDGSPLGVPVIVFRNRGKRYTNQGLSEIEGAIPLQDALNRTLYSMIMTGELTGFPIRYAVGWTPKAEITPGMWMIISGERPLEPDEKIDIGTMEQGQIVPFLEQARWLKGEISSITRTPAPEFMGGDNASGEALKQREVGLIGKVRRFQVHNGNSWENIVKYAASIQDTYGSERVPVIGDVQTRWRDPEIRNDTAMIDNAIKVADRVPKKEFLRLVAPVFGWNNEKIDKLMIELEQENGMALASLASTIPTFGNFNNPTEENITNG